MKSFTPPSKLATNRASGAIQRKSQPTHRIVDNRATAVLQRKLQNLANISPSVGLPHGVGKSLPDDLKAGLESLSGYSLDDVRVHYNSSKPAEVGAAAYAQGSDIYLAPGQEKHLAHEAWHIVQQKQGRVSPTMQLENGAAINDNVGLEQEAERMSLRTTIIDNRPIAAMQRNLQESISAQATVIQRVLHKGTTKKSDPYVKYTKIEGYTENEIREFMNSPLHFGYNRKTKKIAEIVKKPKVQKRKRSSSDTDGEITGWMQQVDNGVQEYAKTGETNIVFEARRLKDANQGGFNVGINNIANLDGMKTTTRVKMNNRQKRINFLSRHLKKEIYNDYTHSSDKEEDDRRRKRRKTEAGPEFQIMVGEEKGKLETLFGGNSQKSQNFLKTELLGNGGENKTLKSYHKNKYRGATIKRAKKRMKAFLEENKDIKAEIVRLKKAKVSSKKISAVLKEAIGNKYKDEKLKYLFTLRNSLKVNYGEAMLEDAIITIPNNPKNIHAESNLLESKSDGFKIQDVVGTKVPCVACFTKFCKENHQAHLLPYTSSIWFSEPCMEQLGCDYSQQSAEEVLEYLKKIDKQMKNMIKQVSRYTGKNGDIKSDYEDEDSDSMGEESRYELIDEY